MMTAYPQVAVAIASLLALAAVNDRQAAAQTFPAKPVRIVVPYPAGGGVDPVARLIAQKLPEILGGQYYVENLPGAGGTIGTGMVANTPADGHTMLFVNPDFVVQPVIKAKVPYDPFKSFAPVSLLGVAPEMIVVHPSVPAKDMRELITLLKANPGKYSYATPGYGSSPHLACERLFRLSHGLDVLHVPFQGGAPAITSTIAGHTSIIHLSMSTLAPHVKQGTLRPLAVTSKARSPAFPGVPTLAEAGIPGHDVEYMIGAVVPAGIPMETIHLLQRAITKIVNLADVKDRLTALGLEPVGSTSEEFAAKLRADHASWSKVVRDGNIKIE
jgi:tripartite-type tricarboxylate transporter receptor subunit TctC